MVNSVPDGRLATRLSFLAAGFGLACWAPMVPLVKARLGLDEGALGLLLLSLGLGSIAAMQIANLLLRRLRGRTVILAGMAGMALSLPWLALAAGTGWAAAGLAVLGGSLGLIEIALNLHAIEVEQRCGTAMMSGFHALFSVGGFAGAGYMTCALWAGLPMSVAALVAAAAMLVAMAWADRGYIETRRPQASPLIVLPHGRVALLAGLAAIAFLAEGAILDWGAVLLMARRLVSSDQAGLGYTVFAVAITVARLAGDRAVARFGDGRALFWGGLACAAGFTTTLCAPALAPALLGFVLVGIGSANFVPILFRLASRQRQMEAVLAVRAVTTFGYAGILMGPATIGLAADHIGLQAAFAVLAVSMLAMPLFARVVAGK